MLTLEEINISPGQIETISQRMTDISEEAVFSYPWDNLEQELDARRESAIPIVGYGSLVNTSSAARTISENSLGKSLPVIAFGARRIFNYEMPPGITRYGPPVEGEARAALNVDITGKQDDVVNGVLFEIDLTDIPAMRKRELAYDLVPLVCIKWNDVETEPFMAYILRCPNSEYQGKHYTNSDIKPHHHYYSVCRDGAKEIGSRFLKVWLRTTYLADGVTPVSEWEKELFW